jgi:hypothetical protein
MSVAAFPPASKAGSAGLVVGFTIGVVLCATVIAAGLIVIVWGDPGPSLGHYVALTIGVATALLFPMYWSLESRAAAALDYAAEESLWRPTLGAMQSTRFKMMLGFGLGPLLLRRKILHVAKGAA